VTSYEIRHAVRADDEVGGLIVTQLRPSGAGALAGLQIGDLITHLGTQQLNGVSQLASIDQLSVTSPLLVRVVRDGVPRFVVITSTSPQSDFGSQPTLGYRQSH
jgi:S1-C subfamily serine protease